MTSHPCRRTTYYRVLETVPAARSRHRTDRTRKARQVEVRADRKPSALRWRPKQNKFVSQECPVEKSNRRDNKKSAEQHVQAPGRKRMCDFRAQRRRQHGRRRDAGKADQVDVTEAADRDARVAPTGGNETEHARQADHQPKQCGGANGTMNRLVKQG